MATEAARLEINVTAPGADDAASKLGKVDKEVGGLSDTIKKLATAGGIALATKAIVSFASDSVKAFGVAQSSALRLNKAMELRGMDGAAGRFTKLAAEMQTLTGVSDEVVKDLASQLVMQGQSEEQTRKLIKAAADLSAVTGDSLDSSVRKLTVTLSGQAGQLGRLNPEIAKMTKEQLESGAAVDLVAQSYAGMAQEMSRTIEVSNKLKDETLGDLSEMIGEFFAPSFMAANDAMIGFAHVGMEVLSVVNEMPEPLKLLITGTAALAAAITALALANSTGLTIMIKKTVAEAIAIAKTVAHTIAKWASYAAQMALNAAMAVTNPLMWAGIAAATAATVAVVAYAASTNQSTDSLKGNATQTGINIGLLGKYREEFMKFYREQKAGEEQIRKNRTAEMEYADALGDVSAKMRQIGLLRSAGIISEEDAIKQRIELQKEELQIAERRAIREAEQAANQGRNAAAAARPFVQAMENYRAEIAKSEAALEKLNEKPVDHKARWQETFAELNRLQSSAAEYFEDLETSRWTQTMDFLNSFSDEYGDVIEDNHAGWMEALEEVQGKYQMLFSVITQGFSAVAAIANNVSKQQIMNLEAEIDKQNEADQERLSAMEARGATEEQMAAAKEEIDNMAMARQQEFEAAKKKAEREAAIRNKAFAMFQAALNIPLMIMEGIKVGGPVGAALYGTLGAVQLAAAASTPIPAAQMGGEFIVPPGYQGDSGLVRVNSGERVSVEPVRDSGSDSKRVTVSIGGRDFEGYMDELLNSGRVTIRRPGVVRYA